MRLLRLLTVAERGRAAIAAGLLLLLLLLLMLLEARLGSKQLLRVDGLVWPTRRRAC